MQHDTSLRCLGVTRVVMEATSDYWRPVSYVLEAHGFETWLVNAKDVKHLPGRPKTDLLTELCGVAAGQRVAERAPSPLLRWAATSSRRLGALSPARLLPEADRRRGTGRSSLLVDAFAVPCRSSR
jgi:hypothetical protein